MDSVENLLLRAVRTLTGHTDSPRLDAEILLGKVLGWSRPALIVHRTAPVGPTEQTAFETLLTRRLQGAPVAYLTGVREFWSLPLSITPAVLVPRPETELLVEHTLRRLPVGGAASILDLGTGSGAIALALASERPGLRITASDVSSAALAVARGNARALELTRIDWRQGWWFDAVPGARFDFIVSNPPYIAADDPALAGLAAEPRLALAPGPTGFEALHAIIDRAAAHLNPEGWLLLEHGSTQARGVAARLERNGFASISSLADHSGHSRITLGTIQSSH